MKKGLIAGGILLGCVLLLSGIAAAEVESSGLVELKVVGDPAGEFSGTVEGFLTASLTASAGSWEGGLTTKFEDDSGDGSAKATLDLDDAYIKYTGTSLTLELSPLGVSHEIYDLGGDIDEEAGITLTANMDPVSITAVLNNAATGNDDDPLNWNYGVEGEYSAGAITMGLAYNSNEAMGLKLVGAMDPMTLTAQYAVLPIEDEEDRTGYLAKAEYALTAGTVSVCYQKSLDDRTIEGSVDDEILWKDHWPYWEGADKVTGDPFIRITAALADFPIAATTVLKVEVVNQDLLDKDYVKGTTFVLETATTLVENVTLTFNLESPEGGDLTYYAKIGVAL